MQRMLYRSVTTNPLMINVFIAPALMTSILAHTINAATYLPMQCRPEPRMRNCIAVPPVCIDDDTKPATLAHEIGHALMDHAEHPHDNDAATGALMTAATSDNYLDDDGPYHYHTTRIADDAWPWRYIVDTTAGPHLVGWQPPAPNGMLGIAAGHLYAMSTRIRQRNTATRHQR